MKSSRILSRTAIATLVERARKSRKKIVFTNGVFDILHRGHVQYLKKARSFGDLLIVGLNTDASVRRLKGKGRPIQKQQDRAFILSELQCVDHVVLFSEDTPERLIKQVKPDVLVKGSDYKITEIVGADFVRSYGGQVKRVSLVQGRSTTGIAKRLKKG